MTSPGAASSRFTSADDNTKLKSIAATSARAEGRVLTLDFSAVRLRLADRWSGKRDDVCAKIEQIIERHMGHSGLFLRLEECEYLVCFSDGQAGAVQAVAFRTMEEILTHFLGCFTPQDLLVNRVTSIADGAVSRTAVERGSVPDIAVRPSEPRSFEPKLAALAAPALIEDNAEPLMFSCGLQEVYDLKTETKIGLRVAPRYRSVMSGRDLTVCERAALSTSALMATDREVAVAIPNLFEEKAPMLIVAPFSLHTLCASKSRTALLAELNRLSSDQRARLVVELGGFETGTPSSRLLEAALMLKPFCRSVSAQILPTRSDIMAVVNARLPSLCVRARDVGGSGQRLAAGLLAFGQAASGCVPRFAAVDLPDKSFLSICSIAGFTIGTLFHEDYQVSNPLPRRAERRGEDANAANLMS